MTSYRLMAIRPCMLLTIGASLIVAGCSSDAVVELPSHEDPAAYWQLTGSVRAATVGIGETLQLDATPKDFDGNPIPRLPAPTYTSPDSTLVSVSPTGLVTGKKATVGLNIIAKLVVDGVTHSNMVTVAVTAARRPLKSFKIVGALGSSTPFDPILLLGSLKTISYLAKDSSDNVVTGLAIKYIALDPRIVTTYDQGRLRGTIISSTRIAAVATVYGTTYTDTVDAKVNYPMSGNVYTSTDMIFSPASLVLGTGSTVSWTNNQQAVANITFDDSTNVTGGNIAELPNRGTAARQFNVPGTFTYRNVTAGTTGVIIVRTQPY